MDLGITFCEVERLLHFPDTPFMQHDVRESVRRHPWQLERSFEIYFRLAKAKRMTDFFFFRLR